MDELKSYYASKKISVDPEAVKLEKYKNTPITGKELDNIGIERLKEWFSAIEGADSPLDDYSPEHNARNKVEKATIYGLESSVSELTTTATKYQKYAIIQNPRTSQIKDGRYTLGFIWEMEAGPFFGYTDEKDGNLADALIKRIAQARRSIILNAKFVTMFNAFRLKTGSLLHIDKTDTFVARTESVFDLSERYRLYETWRGIYQVEDIQAQIADPDAIKFLQEVGKASLPLYDQSSDETTEVSLHTTKLKVLKASHPTPDMTKEWLSKDKFVRKGLEMVEEMTLSNIERTSDRLLDLLREMIKEAENPSEPVPK